MSSGLHAQCRPTLPVQVHARTQHVSHTTALSALLGRSKIQVNVQAPKRTTAGTSIILAMRIASTRQSAKAEASAKLLEEKD